VKFDASRCHAHYSSRHQTMLHVSPIITEDGHSCCSVARGQLPRIQRSSRHRSKGIVRMAAMFLLLVIGNAWLGCAMQPLTFTQCTWYKPINCKACQSSYINARFESLTAVVMKSTMFRRKLLDVSEEISRH
jgi:hypothetical protein